ncbi:MmcB family DNA repair protein [Azospirillum halopraeferens]|uniref:MmcB family DNA repair protein n=1 Tax=Azospirillum halopraeferens TaxID=34010 RepID=UPI0012EB2065|nr:MmcB family DNA repair protein [Azospirillum halopraeferens]
MSDPLTEAPGGEPAGAVAITRGVRRALAQRGFATLTEFRLASGRRADVLAVDGDGTVLIVEVKSSVADFRADRKWTEYRDWCDAFYFAVDEAFPADLIPDDCGLYVADAFGAALLRDAPASKLAAARRKAVVLRAALAAAGRLHRLEDPGFAPDQMGG